PCARVPNDPHIARGHFPALSITLPAPFRVAHSSRVLVSASRRNRLRLDWGEQAVRLLLPTLRRQADGTRPTSGSMVSADRRDQQAGGLFLPRPNRQIKVRDHDTVRAGLAF